MTSVEAVREALGGAGRLVVVTGSGISAAAGLSTYRERGSAWTDRETEAKSQAHRYGSHLPELWGFWGQLREQALNAEPTRVHQALRGVESTGREVVVVTQNVDGLHGRAGSAALEVHGSILRTRCLRCRVVTEDRRCPEAGQVPPCVRCGQRKTRPDVVLFGERPSPRVMASARRALVGAQACLYVGTSGQVWPVAGLAEEARRAGVTTILVNQEPWGAEVFDHVLLGDAQELVPELLTSAQEAGSTR